MPRAHVRSFRLAIALVWATVTMSACGGGNGSFVGKWESNFGGAVSLELAPGGKAQISTIGIPSEGTWEVTGKNKIVVHGPRQDMTLSLNEKGELTDGMLGVFTRTKN